MIAVIPATQERTEDRLHARRWHKMVARKLLFVLMSVMTACGAGAAPLPDSSALTPVDTLPLFAQTLRVDPKFSSSFPVPHTLRVPEGFTVNVFAASLRGARFMDWSPDSVLYVCAMQAGQVVALPDHDHDGVADSQIVVADNLYNSHSLAFYRDTLYVSEITDVLKMIDRNGDRVIDQRVPFITGLADGGHTTRTLLFDPPNHKLYVHVGSSCNICNDPSDRACVMQFNDDGTGQTVYASGLRNSVGLAFNPLTHALWADNNGFDNAGNDIPPEAVNILVQGGFYGWPLAYGNGLFNPRYTVDTKEAFTHDDSMNVAGMTAPVVQITAHSAPLGLHFYTAGELPAAYVNSALMCLHGSWNRSPASGCKVVRLRGNPDGTNMRVADFAVGWQTDSVNVTRWGRPVGVTSDHRGNIYISDDQAGAIYRLHYSSPAGVHGSDAQPMPRSIRNLFPDPAGAACAFDLQGAEARDAQIMIVDERGATVYSETRSVNAGVQHILIDTTRLAAGAYRLVVTGAAPVPLHIIK